MGGSSCVVVVAVAVGLAAEKQIDDVPLWHLSPLFMRRLAIIFTCACPPLVPLPTPSLLLLRIICLLAHSLIHSGLGTSISLSDSLQQSAEQATRWVPRFGPHLPHFLCCCCCCCATYDFAFGLRCFKRLCIFLQLNGNSWHMTYCCRRFEFRLPPPPSSTNLPI